MLVFAILRFFVTVFIAGAGAGLLGHSPSGDFVVLATALLAAGAIVAEAGPMTHLGETVEAVVETGRLEAYGILAQFINSMKA